MSDEELASAYQRLEGEKQELERRLAEAQARIINRERGAADARIAAGFAHEMKNALTSAKAFLSVAIPPADGGAQGSLNAENSRLLTDLFVIVQAHLPASALPSAAGLLRGISANEKALYEATRGASRSVERALKVTRLILEYARAREQEPGAAPCSVRRAVLAILEEHAVDLAAHRIEVAVSVPDDCVIVCDEAHLDSILRNLIVNARDALTDTDGSEARRLLMSAQAEPDGGAAIRIEDTGIGIPREHLGDIFEPFFSTKSEAGTGLGLSVVQKLVWLYRGTISVESEVGRGTLVCVRLPGPLNSSSA